MFSKIMVLFDSRFSHFPEEAGAAIVRLPLWSELLMCAAL